MELLSCHCYCYLVGRLMKCHFGFALPHIISSVIDGVIVVSVVLCVNHIKCI